MITQLFKLTLSAVLVLAIALTISCSSDKDDGRGSDFGGNSNNESGSVTYALTCTAVPSTGIASIAIIPPTVTCNGTVVSSGFDWVRAPNWSNPAIGTYNDILVFVSSGECKDKSAKCSGTLTVGAAPSADQLTCTGMPATGFAGTAITQPTVRCGVNTVATGITWANAPVWANPAANTYNVSATANCGGSSKTASCGELTVASVLACSEVPQYGMAAMAITPPAVTCNGTAVSDSLLDWIDAPDWSYPAAGTYSDISVSASYGECSGKTATCSGTLTVAPASSSSSIGSSSSNVPPSSSSIGSSSSSVPPSSSSSTLPSSSSSEYTGGSCNAADYGAVNINGQIWMVKNWGCYAAGSKCYDNDPANCTKYGRLYDWATAMALPASCNSSSCVSQIKAKHQGVCPTGWHIPSTGEWDELMEYVDSNFGSFNTTPQYFYSLTAGRYLKATDGWNDYYGISGNGTDDYGFSALPGGRGYSSGYFDDVGNGGEWWSTYDNRDPQRYTWYWFMRYSSEHALWYLNDKINLSSVRCLKD